MLDESNREQSRCIRCSTCDGFPCLVDAKADAHTICVRPALKHGNVTLLTNAFVKRLDTSESGREVSGVVVDRGGAEETYTGDLVVVSCGAINSAALLLRSANERHRDGLANGSGVVGRNYMAHNNSALVAVSRRANPTVFQKTLGVNDYYNGAGDFAFPLGHFQMLGKSEAEEFKGDAKFAPGSALEVLATHALDFWLTSEDLPDPENRVVVKRDGTLQLRYMENNLEGHRRLVAKLEDSLEHIGCETHLLPNALYLGKKIPVAGVAHQNGTIRFGTDPRTSALDVNCKTHELDNLYVVDGSFFVSSAAVNPALTIMANALRVAEHLSGRLSALPTAA
jgi:choline dehydrogenase-like flavoprotein